jgi:hypothetical protein
MGMDVHGIAPQTIGDKPERPENWDSLTEYEQDMYYNELNSWESNNPGVYFRASYWSWRPIYVICNIAIDITKLPFDTNCWDSNDGKGLKNQEECDMLADAIEVYLTLNNANMHDQDDRIYLCLGSWTTANGHFMPKDLEDELNETYKQGTILYRGVVTKDGTLAYPAHSCPLYHIQNFVTFLRKCGGFEIW